jgi:hypothetical protein
MKYVLLLIVLLLSGCAHDRLIVMATTNVDNVDVIVQYELK